MFQVKSIQAIESQLKKISTLRKPTALGVLVNSPGGSPAQCEIIVETLKQFTHHHHIPLYTFGLDVAASGGYFILSAGDKVFADPSCLVGSIGVISQHISFKDLIQKHKLEYRKIASND